MSIYLNWQQGIGMGMSIPHPAASITSDEVEWITHAMRDVHCSLCIDDIDAMVASFSDCELMALVMHNMGIDEDTQEEADLQAIMDNARYHLGECQR